MDSYRNRMKKKKNMKPKKEEENKLVDSTPLTNKEREEFEELKIQYEI